MNKGFDNFGCTFLKINLDNSGKMNQCKRMNDTTNTYKLTFENGSNVTVKSDSIENAKRKVCSRIGASRLGEMVSAILVETKAQQKANTEKAILIATLGECF